MEVSFFEDKRCCDELLLHIFSFLSPRELARVSRVNHLFFSLARDCSLWNSFDLKNLFPRLTIIDETVWRNCFDLTNFQISFNDSSPLNKYDAIRILEKMLSQNIADEKGVTLLAIPKGLSWKTLLSLINSYKNKREFLFRYNDVGDDCLNSCKIKNSYYLIISNSIIQGSGGITAAKNQELVEKNGFEVSDVLSIVTLIFLTYVNSDPNTPVWLYGKTPYTYTYCQSPAGILMIGGCEPPPSGLFIKSVDSNYSNNLVGTAIEKKI